MGDGGFNDRYWTLEQALGWMLTRDREFVDQNSGEALTALSVQARGDDGRPRLLRTPLTEFLIESPEVQQDYDRCLRELHRTLKEGKLHALGELKSIKRRVGINPPSIGSITPSHQARTVCSPIAGLMSLTPASLVFLGESAC